MSSEKKISRILQCGGKINGCWLKYKIFASQQKKFITIASVVWNMKALPKPHRLRRNSCHCRKRIMKEQPSLWYQTRNAQKKAFVALANHITEEVINRKQVLFVADLNRFYEELVNDLADDESDVSYNARKLEGKILNYFGDRIQLVMAKTTRGNMICDKKYTTEEAIRLSDKQNIQTKIRDVALFLRREILQADYKPLPNTVSLEDIRKREVNTPKDLVKFLRYLIGGPYVGRELTAAKTYRIKSISEDVVFATISVRRRPAKHLQIGMAIKSLTGRKKVVTMLNRLGHGINWNGIEELETVLTYNCSNANQITPAGMSNEKSCSTGLAFDNYDRDFIRKRHSAWHRRNSISNSFRYSFFAEEFFALNIF